MPNAEPLEKLAERLQYRFDDWRLLDQALTHRSIAKSPALSNERMEFLGDAVLSLTVSAELYRRFPDEPEGRLSKLRSKIVNNRNLAAAARRIDLGSLLRISPGEDLAGGRSKPRLLADAFEAVVGAVYVDGGMEPAAGVVGRLLLHGPAISEATEGLDRSGGKSALQEWLQARGLQLPEYAVLSQAGPPNDRTFRVEVRCAGHAATATASRKQVAEEAAANRVLDDLVRSEGGEAQC